MVPFTAIEKISSVQWDNHGTDVFGAWTLALSIPTFSMGEICDEWMEVISRIGRAMRLEESEYLTIWGRITTPAVTLFQICSLISFTGYLK